jgi:hypothetical protein
MSALSFDQATMTPAKLVGAERLGASRRSLAVLVLVGMPQYGNQSFFLPKLEVVPIEHVCSYMLGFFVIITV